jgi:type IV secretory pathway TraG/TraD family ATPase VirD4
MKFLRSFFERENQRWAQILATPQKLEEHPSRRLDSDKIVFSPRLNPSQMDALRMNKGDQRSHELVAALRDGFFEQPPEQLGGVQGTLSTYLEFFINPEFAEVFCANEPTFSMDQIDAGKVVCIAMPQKFQSERLTSTPS